MTSGGSDQSLDHVDSDVGVAGWILPMFAVGACRS
jgi:hypothetical protein